MLTQEHSRGGLFELASWRWLFRFLAIVALLSAGLGFLMMPKAKTPKKESEFSKLERLDIVGVGLLTGCLLLFILGLTSQCFRLTVDQEVKC